MENSNEPEARPRFTRKQAVFAVNPFLDVADADRKQAIEIFASTEGVRLTLCNPEGEPSSYPDVLVEASLTGWVVYVHRDADAEPACAIGISEDGVLTGVPGDADGSVPPWVDFLAKACHYAQEHFDDADAWGTDFSERFDRLQCVSYQAACFLAQNTALGGRGVPHDVFAGKLAKHPGKSVERWRKLILREVEELGGFASNKS